MVSKLRGRNYSAKMEEVGMLSLEEKIEYSSIWAGRCGGECEGLGLVWSDHTWQQPLMACGRKLGKLRKELALRRLLFLPLPQKPGCCSHLHLLPSQSRTRLYLLCHEDSLTGWFISVICL